LAKYLPAHGWRPIVVRADERHYTEPLDPALAALVPDTLEQVRTQALPASLMRLIGIGDIGLRGYPSFRAALDALAISERIDAVLITGSPFYPMLLARHVKRRWGIPVVLDFQDPWVSAEGARRPRWTKGWAAHRLAVKLEPTAVRYANFITSVSVRQNEEMVERYPFLDRSIMMAIPIGGDPDDFHALDHREQVALEAETVNVKRKADLRIRYVGTLWPAAIPVLNNFLQSIAELRERRVDLYRRLKISFIGTTRNSHSPDGCWVAEMAGQLGIADVIETHQDRVGYLDALRAQSTADVVLILGSTEPHYTASKIYGVLMSEKPFLSIFHRESSSHKILADAGGGIAIGFGSESELAQMVDLIASAIETLLENVESIGKVNPASYAQYTANAVAAQFAEVFARACTAR
jgi:hypothetical protein